MSLLPSEIYHIIFDYFWAHEILYSFCGINDYIDNILLNYQNYKINGKSIRKSHFDLLCQIRPNQVISLILSDDSYTPNQSQLFRSLVSIEQFTRLRSLKLIELDDDGASFFSDLYKLKHLVSLEINLKDKLPFIKTSPPLQRLIINIEPGVHYDLDPLITMIQFEHLRQLTLSNCSCRKLQQIFHRAIHLISLKISLMFTDAKEMAILIDFHQEQSKIIALKSLSLSIEGYGDTITRAHLEAFLTPLKCLRKLELIISCFIEPECYDANQWKIFIIKNLSRLIAFNFNFSHVRIDKNALDQYRHPFWMNKCWFVATDESYSSIYSVPHFSSTSMKYSSIPISSKYTTLPIDQHITCYDRVTQLEYDSGRRKAHHRYNYIEKIYLTNLNIDKNAINLSKVKSLIIKNSQWAFNKILILIKEAMPSVNYLSLNCPHPSLGTGNLPDISLKQIKTLVLPKYAEFLDDDYFVWSLYFPCVERLVVTINSKNQIPFLIDEFGSMVSGFFHIDSCLIGTKKPIKMTCKWLIKHTHRLTDRNPNDFVCQINDQYFFSVCLWIADDDDDDIFFDENKEMICNSKWWNKCFSQNS
ncbi:unnamed protein product, partial [Adineta steineri]